MNTTKINKELVKEVFKSMSYNGEKEESKESMEDFLKQQSSEEINSYIVQFVKCDKWCSLENHCRQKLLNKLASEIEKGEHSFIKLLTNVSPFYIRQKLLPYLAGSLRYYANYCQLVEENARNVLVCRLSEVSNLSLLGYILGPSLAAGCKILFIASHELANILKFIELMMRGIGFPEGCITVILDDVDMDLVLQHANMISLFGITNQIVPNKKIMGINPLSVPIVVFDNADLDSACECVINATWKYQLLFDSTAKEVFVQETVFEMFVKKLKKNMSISANYNNTYQGSLESLISRAEKNGIEVVSCNTDDLPRKTLFIGGRLFDKSTIAPCVSVVAFRNVDEAIALANNNVQGLSASVWTENIGLANYVTQKLEVSNIWINSFGIYSFDVAFAPRKLSGRGYFGGIQGFQEFHFRKNIKHFSGEKIVLQSGEKIFSSAVVSAKKAYSTWSSIPRFKRILHFRAINQYIENNRSELKSKSVTEEWLNMWKTLYYQYIDTHYDFSVKSPIEGFGLNVSYSPRGVIVSETTNNVETHNIKLLVSSIIEGNSFILLNQCEQLQKFYNGLSRELPVGVFSVLPYFSEASGIALRSPEVDVYFNEYIIDEDLDQHNKFEIVTTNWKDIFNKVTCVKNIWSNIGK